MNRTEALDLLRTVTAQWAADDQSDVVWAGEHEGRWGIRLAQTVRDFTTIWFDVGDITIGFEAYLLPDPPYGSEAVYRFCLARNWSAWPAAIAVDRTGDLYVRGRIPLTTLDATAIDRAVGAVYEAVELSFRRLVELGFRITREK